MERWESRDGKTHGGNTGRERRDGNPGLWGGGAAPAPCGRRREEGNPHKGTEPPPAARPGPAWGHGPAFPPPTHTAAVGAGPGACGARSRVSPSGSLRGGGSRRIGDGGSVPPPPNSEGGGCPANPTATPPPRRLHRGSPTRSAGDAARTHPEGFPGTRGGPEASGPRGRPPRRPHAAAPRAPPARGRPRPRPSRVAPPPRPHWPPPPRRSARAERGVLASACDVTGRGGGGDVTRGRDQWAGAGRGCGENKLRTWQRWGGGHVPGGESGASAPTAPGAGAGPPGASRAAHGAPGAAVSAPRCGGPPGIAALPQRCQRIPVPPLRTAPCRCQHIPVPGSAARCRSVPLSAHLGARYRCPAPFGAAISASRYSAAAGARVQPARPAALHLPVPLSARSGTGVGGPPRCRTAPGPSLAPRHRALPGWLNASTALPVRVPMPLRVPAAPLPRNTRGAGTAPAALTCAAGIWGGHLRTEPRSAAPDRTEPRSAAR